MKKKYIFFIGILVFLVCCNLGTNIEDIKATIKALNEDNPARLKTILIYNNKNEKLIAEREKSFLELKAAIPLIKQWVEAKENYCKLHKDDCQVLKDNGGFCYDDCRFFRLDASDFGVKWPSEWMDKPTGLLSDRTKPKHCTNELHCISENISCFANQATVFCTAYGLKIMGALKDISNYPLGNQLSCLANREDKMGNDFCKEISGKESMSFNYNPDLEDEQSRFRSFCKDPANASYCKKWMAEIVAEHPLDEFNFYPL